MKSISRSSVIVSIFLVGFLVFIIYSITYVPKSISEPFVSFVGKELFPSRIPIEGSGYKNATLLVFVDGQPYSEIDSKPGSDEFRGYIDIEKSGNYTLSFKQRYKTVTSEFTNEYEIQVDTKPPNVESFILKTTLPKYTKKLSLIVEGRSEPNTYVHMLSQSLEVGPDGKYKGEITLSRGENDFYVTLTDSVGNSVGLTKSKGIVIADDVPPSINKPFGYQSIEEGVVISIGAWQGYLDSYTSVPITGEISNGLENIKSITVDGKSIKWDQNGEIYKRITLFIRGGLNKYKVVVVDKAGNRSTGYIETTSGTVNDQVDVNIYNN